MVTTFSIIQVHVSSWDWTVQIGSFKMMKRVFFLEDDKSNSAICVTEAVSHRGVSPSVVPSA